jgi:TetR/AcrR family tetracycline transcriptional repressor
MVISGTLLQMTESPASRERIIAAARALITADGVDGLSMRKVAAEVGLAPTAIYWHVGSRDDLLSAVLDDLLADLPPIEAVGVTAAERVGSVARTSRAEFLEGMTTLQLANQIGRGNELSFRAQVAMARELSAAGLVGAEAASLLRALMFLVGGFVVIEQQYREREPGSLATADLWAALDEADIDPELRDAMAGPTDTDALFAATLERLLSAGLDPS